MGKLAERYGDAARSGVYAVRDAAIPRAAATEAGALLLEFAAERLAEDWAGVEEAIACAPERACVVLVPDATALADPRHRGVLATLSLAAQARGAEGRPFFVVMVDPGGRLDLRPLYHERGPGVPPTPSPPSA